MTYELGWPGHVVCLRVSVGKFCCALNLKIACNTESRTEMKEKEDDVHELGLVHCLLFITFRQVSRASIRLLARSSIPTRLSCRCVTHAYLPPFDHRQTDQATAAGSRGAGMKSRIRVSQPHGDKHAADSSVWRAEQTSNARPASLSTTALRSPAGVCKAGVHGDILVLSFLGNE